jgi:hypothetical protein
MHTSPSTEIGYNYIFFQVKKKKNASDCCAQMPYLFIRDFFLAGCESGLHVGSESTTLTRWVIIDRGQIPVRRNVMRAPQLLILVLLGIGPTRRPRTQSFVVSEKAPPANRENCGSATGPRGIGNQQR